MSSGTEGPNDEAAAAEMLERFRRSGVSLDREGRFVHEGEVITHEGLRRALFRWLDRLPDGRYILRLDERRYVYVDVDETPLVVQALRFEGDDALLALSDGAEETLAPGTLSLDERGGLRCLARGGRLEARFATSAAATLAERIETGRDDRPALRVGPALVPIGRHPAGAG